MLTITVKDIVEGLNQDEILKHPYGIYLVKDEGVALYVGRAVNPIKRLEAHFGVSSSRHSGSGLGEFYKDYPEEAHTWEIELYTLEECSSLVKQYLNTNLPTYERADRRSSELAEIAMMRHYKPSLNTSNNTQGTPLPAKYKRLPNRFFDNNAVDKLSFLARD